MRKDSVFNMFGIVAIILFLFTGCVSGDDDVVDDDDDDDNNDSGCTSGESRCVSTSSYQMCSADDEWGEEILCLTGQICQGVSCVDISLDDDDDTFDDDDDNDDTTNDDDDDTMDDDDDDTTDDDDDNGCTPTIDFQCEGSSQIRYCNEDGTGYDDPQDCPTGTECGVNGCTSVTYFCQPNEYYCLDAQTIAQCNEDGTDYLAEHIDCIDDGNGARCIAGQCLDLCGQAEAVHSYIGCKYWPISLPNPQLDSSFKSGNESEFAVVISNTNEDYTAEVTIEDMAGFTRQVQVQPLTDQTVRLPYKAISETDGGTSPNTQSEKAAGKAFRLVSTVPVTVAQFNPLTAVIGSTYAYTNDASLLLPEHIYSKEYLVMHYRPMMLSQTILGQTQNMFNSAAFFTIVASSAGDTQVTVYPKGNTAGGAGIAPMTSGNNGVFNLAYGEILHIQSSQIFPNDVDNSTCASESGYTYCMGPDLTGSLITTTKPVAVYSGNECQFIPHNRWACDHLEQQMFPANTWSTQYVLAKATTPLDTHPNIYKIVAQQDGTELTAFSDDSSLLDFAPFNTWKPCNVVLNRGDYCLIETDKDFLLTSNAQHPILVGQFLVGQDYYTNQSASMGDPSFMLVAPVIQYRNEYIFLVPNSYEDDYITILSASPDASIELDGAPMQVNWEQIAGQNAYVGRMSIADGTHHLVSTARVGLQVYGYDSYVSYAYPAGLDFQNTAY